ncbi:hypothetical protein [Streptomyces sp. NBC_01003]|uniref:hypothetical protein n=1 Tax=Streptomyces sp. NBC_01003 TaxID=2903714 RepID=UPI0038638CEE
MAEQDVEVALLDRVARAEVVDVRCAKSTTCGAEAAQDAAAQQEVAQDRESVALAASGTEGRARSRCVSAVASSISVRLASTSA